MAKKTSGRQGIIGAVGSVLIGAAILLFVCTMVLNALKTSSTGMSVADRAALNTTIDQLRTFLTVCSVLLGVLGIVLIGSMIIGAIGGGFGG